MNAPASLSPKELTATQLKGSYMLFLRTFFKLRTGKDFQLSSPIGRESHFITIAKALKRVFNGECTRLIINVPPRYGKSELMINFVSWVIANYPDSNFIYTSYAQSLAAMQTETIRDIIGMPYFREMFGVEINKNTGAKDDFRFGLSNPEFSTEILGQGRVFAAGTGGPITGRGSGIKGVNRCGGLTIIDDAHKPEEVSSDTIRKKVNEWFYNTLQSRCNDPKTPIVAIGQMLHEDDLLANLRKIKKDDGTPEWEVVCLAALDGRNNALYPEMHTTEALLKMKRESPYVFASQYQQNPLPAGGGIFQKAWFTFLDAEPQIISTFITADTACSSKDYADFTVFSFWGIYKMVHRGIDLNMYGLHWLDCRAIKVEPKDLENEFYDFYARCRRHRVAPMVAAIEKASTGITLCSVLQGMPGLRIMDIERTRAGGSKTQRFLEAQPYVASKRITFTKDANHAEMCIDHCSKITSNNSHANDDIADTMQAAIQCALIECTLLPPDNAGSDLVMDALTQQMNTISHLRRQI